MFIFHNFVSAPMPVFYIYGKVVFYLDKHLTFGGAHVKMLAIQEKALTKTVRQRDPQRAGVWCKPVVLSLSTHPFRAGEPKISSRLLPFARVKG